MDSLTIKLASIAVHAEELLSPDGREADREALRGLLVDPEVRVFLNDKAHAVYLPLKRQAATMRVGGKGTDSAMLLGGQRERSR